MRGILSQNCYHSILQCHAVTSSMRLVDQGFILDQDIDPKLNSELCLNYLWKKEQDGKLENMEWPAQSPDLNPIKLVWNELDRRMTAKQHTSATHFMGTSATKLGRTFQRVFDFHCRKNAASVFSCYIRQRWLF